MKKLPKRVMLKWEEFENDTPMLLVQKSVTDAAEIGKTVILGIYELKAVKKVVCEPELVD